MPNKLNLGGAARQLRNALGCRLARAELLQPASRVFYTRWLIFCNLPAEFLQPATRIFTTSQPNVYNQPAECLQPASRMFTTCHPFVFLQQHSLFLILPMLIVFYLARCTHNVSVTHGKPWPSQATPRPRVDCYCHDWPAKQPRDRGLIVTIGQPSKPATAV